MTNELTAPRFRFLVVLEAPMEEVPQHRTVFLLASAKRIAHKFVAYDPMCRVATVINDKGLEVHSSGLIQ